MALETNFNLNPYNDDYDADKDYYRLLFKPGYAVQARELTQIQSVLQSQVGRFGNHVFKNGSVVSGGEFFLHKAKYVKINSNYESAEVNEKEFENKVVFSDIFGDDGRPTKRAQVLKTYNANPGNGDPKTLLVAPIYGDNFSAGELVRTRNTDLYLTVSETSFDIPTYNLPSETEETLFVDRGLPYLLGETIKITATNTTPSVFLIGIVNSYNFETGELKFRIVSRTGIGLYSSWTVDLQNKTGSFGTNIFANAISQDPSGDCLLFSVAEGIFYYDGFFVRNAPQTIAVSKYSYNDANASARIGFEIIESIVDSYKDTSLLDPAQDASNYQAPGSDRYKIELVLAKRSLDSTDDNKFIELMRVENGVILSQNKFPIYAVLEETLARRTYDESGNYTVRPFKISIDDNKTNTANANVIISPGKAYVFGREFETISPTTLNVDKPRTSANVINEYNTAEYGYFVYTTDHSGSFPINSLNTVNLHCVLAQSINTSSLATIQNTHIGTARVKNIQLFDYTDSSNANTYVYKTFLFDIQINSSITGNVNVATSNTISIGNPLIDYRYTTVVDAYKGAKLTIKTGPGSNEPPKTIVSFEPTTQKITISNLEAFATIPDSSSIFSIDFDIQNIKSLASFNGTSKILHANIDNRSKTYIETLSSISSPYDYTAIQERNKEPLLFKIGQDYVKESSIKDLTYTYKRLFKNVLFSSNTVFLTASYGEELESSNKFDYVINVSDKTGSVQGSGDYDGRIVSYDRISVTDRSNGEIFVTNSGSMRCDILAPVKVNFGNFSSAKSKQLVISDPSNVQLGTTISVKNEIDQIVANVQSTGITIINSPFVLKSPNQSQSLYVSDVTKIVKIVEVDEFNINQPQLSVDNGTDVTSSYDLDTGQRDSFYDHSSIRLRSKTQAPTKTIVVFYERFKSVGSGSFFSVDSYQSIPYENIPSYVSSDGTVHQLRDYLDFRPVRKDGEFGFNVLSGSGEPGPGIPEVSSGINFDYDYYLPRIDRIVLDKDKTFKILKGSPSLNPVTPKESETAMTLFVLRYPPYVTNIKDVSVRQIDQKRYTMRDIGKIEKRVENLEYYTALSLLEQQTLSQQDISILDSNGLPRFKNGILVDNFSDFSATDVENKDYVAGIDQVEQELVPSVVDDVYQLVYKNNELNSENLLTAGSLILKNANHVEIINQPKASLAINVNPFNVLKYEGFTTLIPDNDIWVDQNTSPTVAVDLTGGPGSLAAWDLIAQTAFSSTPGNWITHWFGFDPSRGRVVGERTRTVTTTGVVPERATVNIGDRLVDVSVVPFMRAVVMQTLVTGMKSNATVYPFFDNVLVEDSFISDNQINLKAEIGAYVKPITSSSQTQPPLFFIKNWDNIGTTQSVYYNLISGNIVYFSNANRFDSSWNPISSSNVYIMIPEDSLSMSLEEIQERESENLNISFDNDMLIVNVKSFSCYSGYANTTNLSPTTKKVNLSFSGTNFNVFGADNLTNDKLVNKKINFILNEYDTNRFITTTISRTIENYDSENTTVTLSSSLPSSFTNVTSSPFTSSKKVEYSIDLPKTDSYGSLSGKLSLPAGQFRTGDKSLRFIDNKFNDLGSASTWTDSKFFAQGTLKTIEPTLVSVVQPRLTTTSTVETEAIYIDPLAQTFAVDGGTYPRGIFISKVRLCFKSKPTSNSNTPIRLEIRPTVNGYPSSREIYPYASVELTPQHVTTTDTPSLTTNYTEFVFPSPVYLLPGEHSIVLISSSNEYEVYAAEMGARDLNTDNIISDQPYGGSLFKSQNAQTWTAEQNIDMMFGLYRYDFNTTPVSVEFNIFDSSELIGIPEISYCQPQIIRDHEYDTLCLGVTDLQPPGTSISYEFNSLSAINENFVGYKTIEPRTNYELNDGGGRRKISSDVGNNSIIVRATLKTDYSDVSPLIKADAISIHAIKNIMNNLELSNNDIVIEKAGKYQQTSVLPSVVISGGNGTGANAYVVLNDSREVINVIFDSVGSGYTESPTIQLVGGIYDGQDLPVISYNGETSKSGGNAEVRHLTKTVTLADGFDSGDLRVYVTAYKPAGSNIHVYYKILSDSDPETLDDKSWQLMTPLGQTNIFSANRNQYREIVYAPGKNGIPDNSVSYDTYTSFKTFKIKIVLSGVNTTDPPRVSDIRMIALPGETL